SRERAAFSDGDLIVIDNHTGQSRFLAPLDLLSIPLEEHAPTNSQPENWVVTPAFLEGPQPVLRRCTGKRTVEFLLSHAQQSELVLQSAGDSLRADQLAQQPLSESLTLVLPEALVWNVSAHHNHPGKLQVRAEFRVHASAYNLVVTDP